MECGGCQACCKLLKIQETESDFNEKCKYQCKDGCAIYGEHPEGCKLFSCAWKQMKHVALALRPDLCGVMFEKATDKVMYGVTNKPVSDFVVSQFKYFNSEGVSVVLINHMDKSKTNYLAPGHSNKFVEKEIGDDSTELY